MKLTKISVLGLCLCFGITQSQTLNLTGMVTDDKAAPLAGVQVKLKKGGYSAVTLNNGSFSLTNLAGILPQGYAGMRENIPMAKNGSLFFKIKNAHQNVSLKVLTLDGKSIYAKANLFEPGVYHFTPSIGSNSTPIIVMWESEGLRYSFKFLTSKKDGPYSVLENSSEAQINAFAKLSSALAVLDTLVVSKATFKDQLLSLQSYTGSLGTIVLTRLALDTTKLNVLTPDSLYRLAYAEFKATKYDSAIALLNVYLTHYPSGANAGDAQYFLARSFFEQGISGASRNAFQMYLKNYALGSHADWSNSYIGRSYLDEAKFDSARIWFSNVLTKYPDSSSADNAQYYTGISYYDQKNYAPAIIAFTKLVSTYPKSNLLVDAHLYLGKSNYHQNNYPNALTEFNIVLTTFSTSSLAADAQLGIGEVYLAMGATDSLNYPKALIAYNKVINNYPNSTVITSATEGVGESYYYLNDFVNARIWLKKISTNYPLSIYVPTSYYWLGRCDMQQVNYTSALVWFNLLTQNYPKAEKFNITLYQMGKCNYLLKTYPASLTNFKAFQAADPNSSFADNSYYYTVRIYTLQKNCVQAKAELATMARLYPASTVLASTQKYVPANGCP